MSRLAKMILGRSLAALGCSLLPTVTPALDRPSLRTRSTNALRCMLVASVTKATLQTNIRQCKQNLSQDALPNDRLAFSSCVTLTPFDRLR